MVISTKLPPACDSIDELINKGGSVPKDHEQVIDIKNVQLRLPINLIKEIDRQCQGTYKVKKSRHSWILDAIVDKIEKMDH